MYMVELGGMRLIIVYNSDSLVETCEQLFEFVIT